MQLLPPSHINGFVAPTFFVNSNSLLSLNQSSFSSKVLSSSNVITVFNSGPRLSYLLRLLLPLYLPQSTNSYEMKDSLNFHDREQSNFCSTVISPVTGGYKKIEMFLPPTSSLLMGMMMSTTLVKMNRISLEFQVVKLFLCRAEKERTGWCNLWLWWMIPVTP